MNEDDVRALLHAAHVDDNAPSFASTLARSRNRRAPLFAIPAAAFAVAAAAVFLVVRVPQSSSSIVDAGVSAPIAFDAPELRMTTLRTPTDALLDVPGATFLSSTPQLHEGVSP